MIPSKVLEWLKLNGTHKFVAVRCGECGRMIRMRGVPGKLYRHKCKFEVISCGRPTSSGRRAAGVH